VDVHVSNLRQKLSEAGGGDLIRTVRGVGYALR
jgi:DNA-binding response OmpR family regulator